MNDTLSRLGSALIAESWHEPAKMNSQLLRRLGRACLAAAEEGAHRMTQDTTTPTVTLLPCPNPWCESHERPERSYVPFVAKGGNRHRPGYSVQCPVCPSRGPFADTEAEAITAWNTRAIPAVALERDALADELDALTVSVTIGWGDTCVALPNSLRTRVLAALREPRHEPPAPADDVAAFGWVSEIEWHKPAHRAVMANVALGSWMSAALDDPKVCEAMKADIREWFSAGEPMELLGQALAHFRALAASPPREQENG